MITAGSRSLSSFADALGVMTLNLYNASCKTPAITVHGLDTAFLPRQKIRCMLGIRKILCIKRSAGSNSSKVQFRHTKAAIRYGQIPIQKYDAEKLLAGAYYEGSLLVIHGGTKLHRCQYDLNRSNDKYLGR